MVIAEDGTEASYTLEVDRAPLAADATLSGLQLGAGTLTPEFDPDVEEYAVTLPVGTTSLAVTATTVSPTSSVTVDGEAATSGAALTTPASDGHVVKVYVGSSDGTAYTTYSITVAVEAAPVVDTVKPVATLISPTTAGPFRTLSLRVDATDDVGLQRVVANIYKDGVLVKSTQTAANGAPAATHTAEVALPSGTYAIRYNAQDLAGNIAKTGSFTITVDATAPTVTVKAGANETVGADGIYSLVRFKLYDAGKIDKVVVNGTVKDLSNNAWSDINYVKPGVFGAVAGENTLVVHDMAGNTTTVAFTLN